MELEVYKKSDFYEDYISSQKEYYEREQVDTLLAEKDREIALLKERICNGDVSRITWIDDCIAKDKEIAELNAKLENVQASMYADVVDANMDNRRLRRALWIARAERASDKARIFYFANLETMLDIDGFSHDSKKKKGHKKMTARMWRIIWLKVERKNRAKAEEYR